MLRSAIGVLAVVMMGAAGCSNEPAPQPTAPSPSLSTAPAGATFPQGKPFDVTSADLTIHAFNADPETKSGGFRMNCYPSWKDVQLDKNTLDWGLFDDLVSRQKAWGADVLVHSFCATPKWAAAGPVKDPSAEVFGPQTTSPPKDMQDFEDYVREVVKRYKDDISTWEVWNEASSPQFWQGTPEEMLEMTEIVRRVVKEEDPDGQVSMASMQTHRKDYYDGFVVPYLKLLKQAGWPTDIYNGHFYPAGKGGPAARREQIAMFRRTLDELGAPKKPLWDTEVNYYTGIAGGEPDGRITGDRAAAWAVRTYLDGWRLDVPRNYWYFATVDYDAFPGIQTRSGDPATRALATFHDWVVGSRFTGCEQKGDLVNCAFLKDDRLFYIAWAESENGNDSRNIRVPYPLTGSAEVCQLPDNKCKTTSALVVDEVPVLITPTA